MRVSFFITLTVFFVQADFRSSSSFVFSEGGGRPFRAFNSTGIVSGKELSLKPLAVQADNASDTLHLSFEHKNEIPGRMMRESYKRLPANGSLGSAASFEQPAHEIIVKTGDFLFSPGASDGRSFSIFFMIQPYQKSATMNILRREAVFEGQRHGFSVSMRQGLIEADFTHFFYDAENSLSSVRITARDSLSVNRMSSVLIVYNDADGSLSLYMNGREQNRRFLTADGNPRGTLYIPHYHRWDKSPLVIGRGLLASMDELILTHSVLSPALTPGAFEGIQRNGQILEQKPGEYVSHVFDAGVSDSRLISAIITKTEPQGTKVLFKIRAADFRFPGDTSEFVIPFEFVTPELDVRGRFYQYKIEFFSDARGLTSPIVSKTEILVEKNLPPSAPRGLQVIDTTNSSLTIRFMRNAEMDVLQGGRYHLYYGLAPGEPLGVIRYKAIDLATGVLTPFTDANARHTTKDPRYVNYLEITLDNSLITTNYAHAMKSPRLLYEYPLLQPNMPYYFWLTAVDSSYMETPDRADHESVFSQPVFSRLQP